MFIIFSDTNATTFRELLAMTPQLLAGTPCRWWPICSPFLSTRQCCWPLEKQPKIGASARVLLMASPWHTWVTWKTMSPSQQLRLWSVVKKQTWFQPYLGEQVSKVTYDLMRWWLRDLPFDTHASTGIVRHCCIDGLQPEPGVLLRYFPQLAHQIIFLQNAFSGGRGRDRKIWVELSDLNGCDITWRYFMLLLCSFPDRCYGVLKCAPMSQSITTVNHVCLRRISRYGQRSTRSQKKPGIELRSSKQAVGDKQNSHLNLERSVKTLLLHVFLMSMKFRIACAIEVKSHGLSDCQGGRGHVDYFESLLL